MIMQFGKVNKAKSVKLEVCLVVICLLDPMQLDHIEDRVLSQRVIHVNGNKCAKGNKMSQFR